METINSPADNPAQGPLIRVRVAHTHTLKDGWRLSESTIEFTGRDIDWQELRMQMRSAYIAGREEAIYRNEQES